MKTTKKVSVQTAKMLKEMEETSDFEMHEKASAMRHMKDSEYLCDCIVESFRIALMTHNWDMAGRLFWIFVNKISMLTPFHGEIIWKGGLQLLTMHTESVDSILQGMKEFAVICMQIKLTHCEQIILGVVIYCLTHGKFTEAEDFIKEQRRFMFNSKRKHSNSQRENMNSALQGYLGLIHSLKFEIQKQMLGYTSSEIFEAEKAIEEFSQIFSKPGVLDTFYPAYITLLTEVHGVSAALKAVNKYLDYNPDHYTARLGKYQFLKKNCPHNQEQIISSLEHVLELYLEEHLVLEMCKLLQEDGDIKPEISQDRPKDKSSSEEMFSSSKETRLLKCVEYLFNVLDYPRNKNSLRTWTVLASNIQICHRCSSKTAEQIYKLWEHRCEWWPDFHFSIIGLTLSHENSINLLLQKAIVCIFFLGKDCRFVLEVKKCLKSCGQDGQLLESVIDKRKCFSKKIKTFKPANQAVRDKPKKKRGWKLKLSKKKLGKQRRETLKDVMKKERKAGKKMEKTVTQLFMAELERRKKSAKRKEYKNQIEEMLQVCQAVQENVTFPSENDVEADVMESNNNIGDITALTEGRTLSYKNEDNMGELEGASQEFSCDTASSKECPNMLEMERNLNFHSSKNGQEHQLQSVKKEKKYFDKEIKRGKKRPKQSENAHKKNKNVEKKLKHFEKKQNENEGKMLQVGKREINEGQDMCNSKQSIYHLKKKRQSKEGNKCKKRRTLLE